jgi:multiple sugar transport system permease protein
MMLFTAALAAFPTDLLEAAQVDGAGSVKRTLFVVLPNLKGTFLIDIVLVTLATLNDFVLIFTMTGGGPGEESQVLSTYMYQLGFTEYRIAYATAVSVVLLIIGVVLSAFYVRALRKS